MSIKKLKVISTGCLAAGLLFFSPVVCPAETGVPGEQVESVSAIKEGDVAQSQYPLDKAIANSKLIFGIDDSYDIFKSSYNTYDGKKQWNLYWSRSEEPNAHISVQVHAVTGEILNFDRWEELPPGEKLSGLPKYSYQDLTDTANQWVQKLAPAHQHQVKLQTEREQNVPVYGERGPVFYYYNFVRMINGVAYPENNITVRINGDTGQLAMFHTNWDEKATFPPAENIIPADEAENTWREQVELAYFQPHPKPNEEPQLKLVYQLKKGVNPLIDAHTGEIIAPNYYYLGSKEDAGITEQSSNKHSLTPVEQAEVEKIKNILSSSEALKKAKAAVKFPAKAETADIFLEENNYSKQKLWSFRLPNFSVSVDAVTGELINFRKWGEKHQAKETKPKYNVEQCQQLAKDYANKMQPERFAQVEFVDSTTYTDWIKEKEYPRSYIFRYNRVVDGIPFPANGFNIEVNAYTGEIMHYNMDWWEPEFPEPEGIIDQDKAASILLGDKGLEMEYYNTRDKNQKIKLVYLLKDYPSLNLDALSGQHLDWNGKVIPPKLTNEFSDIAGHPTEQAIRALAQAKVVGSLDGNFYPDRNITKMEALTWLVASKNSYILDRPTENLDQDIIDEALRMGLIAKGETENLQQELSRVELAKLMINYLNYGGAAKLADIYVLKTLDAGQVPQELRGYAAISLALGLQTKMQDNYNPHLKIPRGYAALSIYRLLQLEK